MGWSGWSRNTSKSLVTRRCPCRTTAIPPITTPGMAARRISCEISRARSRIDPRRSNKLRASSRRAWARAAVMGISFPPHSSREWPPLQPQGQPSQPRTSVVTDRLNTFRSYALPRVRGCRSSGDQTYRRRNPGTPAESGRSKQGNRRAVRHVQMTIPSLDGQTHATIDLDSGRSRACPSYA